MLDRHRRCSTVGGMRAGAGGALGVRASRYLRVVARDIPFSADRAGPGSLGKFIALMFPPSTGGHLDLSSQGDGRDACNSLPRNADRDRNGVSDRPSRRQEHHASTGCFASHPARASTSIRGIDTLDLGAGLRRRRRARAVRRNSRDRGRRIPARSANCSPRRSRPPQSARGNPCCRGGTRLHAIRFGLLPQVLPIIAGQVLYSFESNTRSATIIGIVGAGGIGLQLSEQIRTYDFDRSRS